MNLRQLKALLDEPIEWGRESITQIVVRFDSKIEYLPQELFTSAPGKEPRAVLDVRRDYLQPAPLILSVVGFTGTTGSIMRSISWIAAF